MKKRLALPLLLILIVPSVVFAAGVSSTPSPRLKSYEWMSMAKWYRMHAEDVAIAESGEGKILFVGDSITECWFQNGEKFWEEHFKERGAINFGIGGDMTQNLLWRLDHSRMENLNPEKMVLLIGTNNFSFTDDSPLQIATGVVAVIDRLFALYPEAELLLMAVYPRGEFSTDPIRAKVRTLNGYIKENATDSRITFLDIGKQFLEANGDIPKSMMKDFLHLSEDAYEIWGNAILDWLDD